MTADSAVLSAVAVCLAVFSLSGCSTDPPPFEADYVSRNTVVVTYQGRRHVLNRHSSSAPVPFTYRFEEDGDLDLLIDGRAYEVDSPYDRDSATKKKKTKTAKQLNAMPKKQPSGAASRQR